MKYLQIHKFRFKTYFCTWKFFINFAAWLRFKTGQVLGSAAMKISNSSKDNFVKKSLPLSTKRKLSILLRWSFPSYICVFKRCIINLEMRNTGLVNNAIDNFCLGLIFSYGTRDPKRFDRAKEWGLGTRQPNLPNVVVKLCHHFVVYCLTRQTLCFLFVVHTRERKRPLPMHLFPLCGGQRLCQVYRVELRRQCGRR